MTTLYRTGAALRLVRESAGFSLDTMARRTNYSECYLSMVETGKRRVTPAIISAYTQVLGDDMHRRQLLLALLGGAAAPAATVDLIGRAFEFALAAPTLTVGDWLAKLDAYGREFLVSMDTEDLQVRLAGDLAHLQTQLGHPELTAVAAQLLTMHGLTVQATTMPADGQTPALRWYALGVRAADRSGDTSAQVWTRGRAAMSLAYHGLERATSGALAQEAVAISDRPSAGRLGALLALVDARGSVGDMAGARSALDDARRTFDAVGTNGDDVSDFRFQEWRMAHTTSRLASRLGEERVALEAQETVPRTLPPSLKWPLSALELQRALLMAKVGDRKGAQAHAHEVLDRLPDGRRPALRILMAEIEGAPVWSGRAF